MSATAAAPVCKYHPLAQSLHWLVAALIAIQVPLAWYMIDLPVSPDKLSSYALHKSLGITIFAVSAFRLAWRWLHPPPALPAGLPAYQRLLARMTQMLLYFCTLAMPLAGWLGSSAANFPVSIFQLWQLPDLVQPDPVLHERLKLVHRLLSYLLIAGVSVHGIAALQHHFVRRDNVLISMLPGVRLR